MVSLCVALTAVAQTKEGGITQSMLRDIQKEQKLTAADVTYKFELSTLVPLANMAQVTVSGGELNEETGLVTFTEKVDSFVYQYDTGHGAMEVTIVFENSGEEPVKPPKSVKGMTLTQEPEDATVRNGQKAKFTVKTIGKPKTIQWYYRTSPTAKWKKVSRNGTKMTLTVTGKPTNNGYQYRCMLKNSHGTLYSNPATLTVELFPPVIITEPQPITVDSGDVAEFTVEAQGDGLTYQWYYCKPLTTTWSKVKNNGTSATLTVTGKPSNNGYQYHCVIKNKDGKVTTQDVTLDVTLFPPEIKVQPQKNATVKIGEAAEFTLEVGGKNVTYQWYYRKTTTGSWTKVKNNDTGATLTVTGKIANDGYQYQCEVKNTDGSVKSDVVTLHVDYHLPEITQQPTGVKAKKGQTVTFTVEAKNFYEAELTYQWYYRKSSSGKWTKVKGATEPVYTFTATTKKNGYQYKCDVSNADGKVSTKTVTLKVK